MKQLVCLSLLAILSTGNIFFLFSFLKYIAIFCHFQLHFLYLNVVVKHLWFSFNQYHFKRHKCRRVFFVTPRLRSFKCRQSCFVNRIAFITIFASFTFLGLTFKLTSLTEYMKNDEIIFEKTLCYLNFVLTFTICKQIKDFFKSVVGELMCINMRGVCESKEKTSKRSDQQKRIKRSLIKCMIITNVLKELFSEWKCYIRNGALNLCQMRMLFCSCSVYKIV